MSLDWIFVIFFGFFLFRGYKRGLILALFSVVALVVGIAAAMKLSGTLVELLAQNHPKLAFWIPLLAHLIVFLAVAWLIHLMARLLQKSFEMLAMGWINRLLGVILYGILFCLAFSVILWVITQMALLPADVISHSRTYSVLNPLAPKVFGAIGKVFPFVKNEFNNLSQLFEQINRHLSGYVNGG